MASVRSCRRAGCGSSQRSNTTAADRVPPPSELFSRLGVWVDHITGFVLGGREDRNGLRPAELLDIVPLDAVVLHPDRPRLGPFTVGTEGDVTLDCVERVRVQVFGKLVVVESLRRGDRVAEDLQFAVSEGRQEVSEQIDSFGRRLRLV